jgi:hypothetical protein
MPAQQRLIAGALVCLAALSGLAATAPAQEPLAAPTYSRTRMGAEDWQARGGNYAHGYGRGGHGWGGGFFQPYISPVIASSWYQRPYPYHFDYFRGRWDGGQANYGGEVPPPGYCPCDENAAAAVVRPDAPGLATP